MSSNGIAEAVRNFVLKKFPSAKKKSFNDDLSLLQSGIIDSLGVLDLVTFLEHSFTIRIADEELTPENFGSINGICSFIKKKKDKLEICAG
jgi:acyl carrier protein